MEKDSRLNEYYIQYSDDGSNWKDYTYEGQRKARLVGLGIFFFHDIHHFEISWFCTHETKYGPYSGTSNFTSSQSSILYYTCSHLAWYCITKIWLHGLQKECLVYMRTVLVPLNDNNCRLRTVATQRQN